MPMVAGRKSNQLTLPETLQLHRFLAANREHFKNRNLSLQEAAQEAERVLGRRITPQNVLSLMGPKEGTPIRHYWRGGRRTAQVDALERRVAHLEQVMRTMAQKDGNGQALEMLATTMSEQSG